MPRYDILEVDGVEYQDEINRFNSMAPEIFPVLKPHHFTDGHWWLVRCGDEVVAFAGIVPFAPCENIWYFKRCFVLPDHRGRGGGLQLRLMAARIAKARQIGARQIISECAGSNTYSASNFRKAGFEMTEPEQRWGSPGSVYWVKNL